MTVVTDMVERALADAARDGDGPLRIYVLDADRHGVKRIPRCVAACHEDSLGFALTTLRDEGDIGPDVPVGVMERPGPLGSSRWLVNPFAR